MTMFQSDYANPPQVNTENAGRLIETLSSSCLLLYEVQQRQQLVIPQQHVSLNQYVAQCVAHKNVKPDGSWPWASADLGLQHRVC